MPQKLFPLGAGGPSLRSQGPRDARTLQMEGAIRLRIYHKLSILASLFIQCRGDPTPRLFAEALRAKANAQFTNRLMRTFKISPNPSMVASIEDPP